jgi:hypothetical protein
MRGRSFPARCIRLAIITLVVASWLYWLFFILLSRTPQPLTLAGCIGLAVAAIAWVVRLLALLVTRRAAAAVMTI